MPRSAGTVRIVFEAGTAGFVADVDKAKAKVREFSTSAVSDHKAAAAATKALEGGFANNKRAADTFLVSVLKLGPALQAAFPVIGGIAFAGMIAEVGKNVYAFFRTASEAPVRISKAFSELNLSARLANDELQVTKDRLANEVAILEGNHPNKLKLMLDEAKQSADKLAESIQKATNELNQEVEKQSIGALTAFFTGQASSGSDKDELTAFSQRMARDRAIESAKVRAAKTDADAQNARHHMNEVLLLELDDEIGYFQKLADQSQKLQEQHEREVAAGTRAVTKALTPDQSTVLNLRRGAVERLGTLRDSVATTGDIADLTRQKEIDTPIAEAAKKSQEELKRIITETNKALEARLSVYDKLDADEKREIANLVDPKNAAAVRGEYNVKRRNAFAADAENYSKDMVSLSAQWNKLVLESQKHGKGLFGDEIEAGEKKLEEMSRSLEKLAKEYNRLTNAGGDMALRHRTNMIGIMGSPTDPLGTLARQQEIEKADIIARANSDLSKTNDLLEKANILKQMNLDLTRLQYEMEEQRAALQQRGIGDFFREMQGQAQTLGNIMYQALHSSLDRVSDELSKLFTGQKTNFGKMLQETGQETLRSSIKSGMQTGIGALYKHFTHGKELPGKPDGSEPHPFYVVVKNQAGATGGSKTADSDQGSGAGVLKSAGGGVAGFLKGLFSGGGAGGAAGDGLTESVTSDITYMASGGELSASQAYIVGEEGPELLSGVSGRITSNAELQRSFGGGGHTFHTSVDARGAELGVEQRVYRAISVAHRAAVSNSLRAANERTKRTPERRKTA